MNIHHPIRDPAQIKGYTQVCKIAHSTTFHKAVEKIFYEINK
jgi:hypothetical protein